MAASHSASLPGLSRGEGARRSRLRKRQPGARGLVGRKKDLRDERAEAGELRAAVRAGPAPPPTPTLGSSGRERETVRVRVLGPPYSNWISNSRGPDRSRLG